MIGFFAIAARTQSGTIRSFAKSPPPITFPARQVEIAQCPSAKAQYEDGKYAGYYNVGPDDKDCVTTGELVDMFCNAWGNGLSWENKSDGGPHEANFLKLDCSKLKTTFGWHPRYGVKEAIGLTVEWCQEYEKNGDVVAVMDRQIAEMFQ